MDFDSCHQLYEDFPSFMTPEYNIDELDDILRSTDANLSSGIGCSFPSQTTFPSPPVSSASNGENLKTEHSDFNPDDFINFFKDEDADIKSFKFNNRNTPSPTNSSSSGASGESVQYMVGDTPPISPPGSVLQLPNSIVPIGTCATPINLLQGTLIPVKTVPLAPIQVQKFRTPIKISPKPPLDVATNTGSKPKTIVLSSGDFKTLMQKINNSSGSGASMPKIIMKTATSMASSQNKSTVLPKTASTIVNSTEILQSSNKLQSLGLKGIVDERHLKKQQRMIKNRESASLSRKKKKDYVVALESRISDLEKENITLKGENTTLRSQLITFTQTCQCSHLKISEFITSKFNSSSAGSTCHKGSSFKNRLLASNMKKNTAVLLAMVFMVSINFGSFHTYFSQEDLMRSPSVDFGPASMYSGRRGLLWIDENGILNITNTNGNKKLSENGSNSTESDDKCPVSINQTENLRLAGELRKWIDVNDYLNLSSVQKPVKFKLSPEFLELKSVIQPVVKPNVKRNRRNFFNRQLLQNRKVQENPKNSLKVFGPQIDNEYLRLFEEIKRRDDTFYVLSFNSDHILLPAAAYNKSTRPKMSLMLPAGDPSVNGDITLMQIDCEVLNTTEVQLKPNMIPSNLRSKFNFHTPSSRDILNKTGGGPEKRAAENSYERSNGSKPNPTPFYRPYFMASKKQIHNGENVSADVKTREESNVDSMPTIKGARFITFQQHVDEFLP